jgi:hypothetical protein
MDVDIVVALISAGFSALFGTVIGHFLIVARYRKEGLSDLRSKVDEKILSAYQKLWVVMSPLAYYDLQGETLIKRNADGVFLNRQIVEQFFTDFRTFFYSEDGMLISRPMREKVFEVREFALGVMAEHPDDPGPYIKISNTKAKKIENGFDWLRKNIRRDVGLLDTQFPGKEMERLERD